jgi:hypothetical protein
LTTEKYVLVSRNLTHLYRVPSVKHAYRQKTSIFENPALAIKTDWCRRYPNFQLRGFPDRDRNRPRPDSPLCDCDYLDACTGNCLEAVGIPEDDPQLPFLASRRPAASM